MKRVAWYTTIVLITISVLVVLWQLRQPVVLFLLSLATAAIFRPFVDYVAGRGIPRGIALIATYALVAVLIAALLFAVGGPLIRDLEKASNQFALGYEHMMAISPESGTSFQRSLASLLPQPKELYDGMAGEDGTWMTQALLRITTNAFAILRNLGVILILSLYWNADSIHFERLLLSLVPVEQRAQARLIWRGIERGVGAYIRSELAQSCLAGIFLWLGYRLMGLDYPVLLALLGSIAWLIPWFGALFAMIPPFLVGLSGGLTLGILAAIYTLAVLLMQEYIIEPRIFRRHSYSSVVLVLVALALGDAFGLVGLILAPLVSVSIQVVFKYVVQSPIAAASTRLANNKEVQGTDSLQTRLAETRVVIESWEEPASPEIVNLIDRLDHLITDTERYLG